ncbi:MAG: AAA domain-containing protein, partial [Bacteroidota bacterium]
QMGLKYKRKFGGREREQRRLLLDEARKLKEDAMALEDHMIYQLLQDAQVIACTLIGSNSDYLRNRQFKTVFIDEASQALEPAAWVPIMKAERVIMAGDHQQLPPTVKSLEAGRAGLSETIFERTINKYPIATMLNEQYRMHPRIGAYSNDYFYGGGIKDGDIIAQRRVLFSDPIAFIDTAGCGYGEEINPETLSTFNKEQANFTLRYLDKLLNDSAEARQSSIGLIAPYKAHVELLRQEVRSYDWFEAITGQLTINSVDAFQGQERDIMLIDLVRSNDRGEVGFLSDIRRTNVAMTRARHKLVIIGDSATLSTNDFYDQLIQYFQQQGAYHSAFEFIY